MSPCNSAVWSLSRTRPAVSEAAKRLKRVPSVLPVSYDVRELPAAFEPYRSDFDDAAFVSYAKTKGHLHTAGGQVSGGLPTALPRPCLPLLDAQLSSRPFPPLAGLLCVEQQRQKAHAWRHAPLYSRQIQM